MHADRLNDGLSVLTAGTGPPLVVLPGLGRGTDCSVAVPRTTAWSVGAVSRGLGRTVHQIHRPLRPPPGTTIADLAGWHATALRTRFAEPVDVLGISGGGITALQLALDHPGTVRRLVVCVAAGRVDERAGRDLLRMVERERRGRSAALLGSRLVAHGPLRLLVLAGSALSALTSTAARAPGEVALVRAVQDWDVTARLPAIDVPVLLVGGCRDRLVPPELVRATASAIPDARLLLLPGRGHLSTLHDPRQTAALKAFLAG